MAIATTMMLRTVNHDRGTAPLYLLEAASTDVEDDRGVLTCCKNNDGREGEPTAWYRENGVFRPCAEFDWEAFSAGENGSSRSVSFDDVRRALTGMTEASKTEAAMRLVGAKVCARATAFAVLKRFPDNIVEDEKGKLWWKE